MLPLTILVVDDEPNIRKTLSLGLEAEGHYVLAVGNAADALAEVADRSVDLAFTDLRLGTASGLDLIPALLARSPWTRIVVITAFPGVETAVESMKRGAADYLSKPFTPAQVAEVTRRVAERRALERKVSEVRDASGEGETILLGSTNAAMRAAIEVARQVAASDATVLIRGESGTGKGVLARAIHAWSGRAAGPFATVSCPSLSGQLLESELFGHARGAFTGAVRDNLGRIAATSGGTLFLDEVGDLPLELQPKLLRFLQDHEYERVGDTVTRRADVRVLTATNADLVGAMRDGRFREDLYYRLNVIEIYLPPLRERADDVPPLAEAMLGSLRRGKPVLGFAPEAMEVLKAYAWPGNVRELRNVVERAVILCQGERVGTEHLPPNLAQGLVTPAPEVGGLVTLDAVEEAHIRRVLAATKTLDEAAHVLGIDAATLWRRRKKYGI
ncbi:MAG TPA: sigma-54 dependent transcriptional regulator [Tepidisphaeraceae bacterium]|jgi:NtrC-family two-component system response regulator AlgB